MDVPVRGIRVGLLLVADFPAVAVALARVDVGRRKHGVVRGICRDRLADRAQLRGGLDLLGRLAGLSKARKQDSDEQRDDGDHDEQFDEREAALRNEVRTVLASGHDPIHGSFPSGHNRVDRVWDASHPADTRRGTANGRMFP